MTKTFASLFTGAGLADEGARLAGLTPIWGVELAAVPHACAVANGHNVHRADVRAVDFGALHPTDWLHASPPCVRASQARGAAQGEAPLDGELAGAVVRAIEDLRPAWFSLENVTAYKAFTSFSTILNALSRHGYRVAVWHLDARDYGVPQRRRRLFLVASRHALPVQPIPTHAKTRAPQGSLFTPAPRSWVGWGEAIPEAEWRSLPQCPPSPWLLRGGGLGQSPVMVSSQSGYRDKKSGEREPARVPPLEPAPCLLANGGHAIWDGEGVRILQPRHLARLCGAPLGWLPPPLVHHARLVTANAVPPPLMRAIIEAQGGCP